MEELVVEFVCFVEVFLLHLVSDATVLAVGGCEKSDKVKENRVKITYISWGREAD